MKITLKKALPWVAAFVAYRLYKMYEVGQQFQWNVRKIIPRSLSTDEFALVVEYEITNPTKTSFQVRKITGEIRFENAVIGRFEGSGFTMKAGTFTYPVTFVILNKSVVPKITAMITKKQFPVFNVKMKTYLNFFSTSDEFNINTADYAKDFATSLIWRK